MHILHVTPYYAPAYAFGGVVRAVEGMARALVRRGHTLTVLTTDALTRDSRIDTPDEIRDDVRVIRARNIVPQLRAANLSTPFDMGDMARELLPSVSVIHCHEFRTLENMLVLSQAGSIPAVLSPHGTLTYTTGRSELKSVWDRILSPRYAGKFRAVIGLTQTEMDESRAYWRTITQTHRTQFFVVPNGVNVEEFAALPDVSMRSTFRARWNLGDAVVCLFMGRLHARKGIDVLIEAFKQANVPNTRLVIAGPDEGMLETLHPLLDDRIVITGFLNGADRLAALAAADVFALPATGEGLSMASLEAMAAGLPVILSPGCNLPEAETYGAGIIREARRDEWAAGLIDLLTDAPTRARMSANARALVSERFTWDHAAERLEAVYQAVIG